MLGLWSVVGAGEMGVVQGEVVVVGVVGVTGSCGVGELSGGFAELNPRLQTLTPAGSGGVKV